MRTSRIAYVALGLIALLLALCLSACKTSQGGTTDERQHPGITPKSAAVKVDSSARNDETLPQKVESSPAKGGKPGLFSGIGTLFSTREGRANRQARKLAKASVPRSIGKGAVYAPHATEVVNAYKPRAAVIKADSGAVVTAIGKAKAPVASAPHATATATTENGLSWWWLLVPAVGVALWAYRKTIPFIG